MTEVAREAAWTPGPRSLFYDEGGVISKIEVASEPGGVGNYLVATELVKAGETIITVDLSVADGRIHTSPTMYSVQCGVDRHVDNVPDDKGGVVRLLCHMEEPTLRVDVTPDLMRFVAVRDLLPGEELGFHYASTEWSMATPFACSRTGVKVQGFRELSPVDRRNLRLRGLVASHIEALANAEGQ